MPIASLSGTRRMPRRWIVFTATALLLHVALIEWATGNLRLPALRARQDAVVVAQVRMIAPPVEVAPAPPATPLEAAPPLPAPPAGAPKKSAPPPPPPPQVLADAIAPGPPAPAQTTEPDPFAGMEVPGTSVEAHIPANSSATPVTSATPAHAPHVTEMADALAQSNPAVSANPTPQKSPPPESARPVVTYKVAPPPSAELQYEVEALRGSQTIHGSGKITWQADGGKFSVNGKAGVLFVNFLNFRSEGMLDQFGVSPVLYSEKPFGKSETNTHFHRERGTISFSASAATYARSGGEQDRASVIWQMASIGRGDSTQIFPGAQIDLMVAGAREAEIWHLRVIGLEDIALASGPASAWHVVRSPRAGSFDKTIDLWLAPRQDWYPVKLRFTEVNGNYIDMALSAIHPLAPRQ